MYPFAPWLLLFAIKSRYQLVFFVDRVRFLYFLFNDKKLSKCILIMLDEKIEILIPFPNSVVLLLLLLNLLLPIGFLDFVTSILFLLLLLKNWGKVLLLLWFNESLGINIFWDIWCKIGIISHERDAVYYVTFINYYLFFFFFGRCKSNTMELEMQFFTENEIKKKRRSKQWALEEIDRASKI